MQPRSVFGSECCVAVSESVTAEAVSGEPQHVDLAVLEAGAVEKRSSESHSRVDTSAAVS